MMNLPKLLAGPMIRRVEKTQAFIWIAMSELYEIEAELFEIKLSSVQHQKSYIPIEVKTVTKTIQLGERLYVYMIRIIPEEGVFPSEVLIGYNLHFLTSSEQLDLSSFGLLSKDNKASIVYEELNFPTFFITDKTEEKLFGSCRKLHGKGLDALAAGDLKLSETYFNTAERPGALFLVGDQIYADDVADPIFPFILFLDEALIGRKEDLTEVENQLKSEHFENALQQIHGRQFITDKFCKFTSNNAHNHLLTFGEYAAMYLLSYSPELWQLANEKQFIHPFKKLVESDRYSFFHPKNSGYDESFARELLEYKTNYEKQLEGLQQFQETLPKIRRLLANIPTYMLFDDHDITDDWNISLEWSKNVYRAPLGRHVIANGLTAYWAFQGWGNHPDEVERNLLSIIDKHLKTLDPTSATYHQWLETMLTFDKWSFVAPTNPKTLFLDTRTMRAFDFYPKQKGSIFKEVTAGPQLINEKGWKIASERLKESGWREGMPLILVSPAPFYGIRLMESFLSDYVLPLKMLRLPVQTAFDLETWGYNGRGYHQFHQWISKWNPSSCVILSGDAHMASSVQTVVSFVNEPKRELFQFTSSPMKNDSFSFFTDFLLKGMLRLYILINGRYELNRLCTDTLHLSFEKADRAKKSSCLWKELIKYHSLSNGSIIETDNNLGWVSMKNEVQFKLLRYKGKQPEEPTF